MNASTKTFDGPMDLAKAVRSCLAPPVGVNSNFSMQNSWSAVSHTGNLSKAVGYVRAAAPAGRAGADMTNDAAIRAITPPRNRFMGGNIPAPGLAFAMTNAGGLGHVSAAVRESERQTGPGPGARRSGNRTANQSWSRCLSFGKANSESAPFRVPVVRESERR